MYTQTELFYQCISAAATLRAYVIFLLQYRTGCLDLYTGDIKNGNISNVTHVFKAYMINSIYIKTT